MDRPDSHLSDFWVAKPGPQGPGHGIARVAGVRLCSLVRPRDVGPERCLMDLSQKNNKNTWQPWKPTIWPPPSYKLVYL